MKIVILDGYTLNPGDLSWEGLKALGEVTYYDRTPHDLIDQRLEGMDIVLTNKTPLNGQLLSKHPSIKLVCVLATGYNVVDINTAKQLGIPVCNVPTYGTDAVAQFVFALLLGLCHRVETHHESVASGEWTKSQDFCYWKTPLFELAGKTLGILGTGKIGMRTAALGLAFGMKVVAFDLYPNEQAKALGITYMDLDQVLKASDVVSLHLPLFESTHHVVNEDRLNMMKKGAYLINTSRGPLVDEEALAKALKSGHLAGAGVDVVSTEPISADNPLLHAPNILITPHIAWAPKEARDRLLGTVVANIQAFLEGKPTHVVNP